MSDLGFQQSVGSSNIGLTFIRPLPQGRGGAHTLHEGEGSSVRGLSLNLTDRLFPPRALEESGAAPPVAGVELGHFVIEERIGRGGMGAVFRAVDKRLGRVVAVKVLTTEHSSDPEAVLRFQNEARAAARLDHENIARVHYIGEDHGLHFIAFEFVMGANVRNLILQRGQFAPAEAVNYTLQIAEALRHTNAANVVHRDIKPSNIIISPSGRAKLVDLGLARHTNPDLSRELTTVGTALGTFDYIAPEQALDARNVDVRSDIYSLGCTLYHMLTGSPPYPTGTMFEKVMNHHRPVPPNPAEKNRQVSPQLARVVQKMMAANPDDRYRTPDDLIDDLIEVAVALGLQPTAPDAKIWQTPLLDQRASRWNGFRTWSTVALILLAVVLADRVRSISPPSLTAFAPPGVNPSPSGDHSTPEKVPTNPVSTPNLALGQGTLLQPQSPLEGPEKTPEIPLNGNMTVPPAIFNPNDSQIPTNIDPIAASNVIPAEVVSTKPSPTNSASPQTGSVNQQVSNPPLETSLGSPRMVAVPNLPAGTESGPVPLPDPAQAGPVVAPVFMAVKPSTPGDPASEERLPSPTLAGACTLAKDGWSVEIPVNASPLAQLETLHITDKRIRIRPSRDYRPGIDPRPMLRVDLSSQRSMGSFSHSAEMLHIDRGSVELSDFDLEMIVDPTATTDWSIATLQNGSQLTAQGVSFTMVNPGNSRAALVNVPVQEVSESNDLMPERMLPRPNQIELRDCICRGQYDFVVLEDGPLRADLQNTALALSGCMFRIDGSESYVMGMESEDRRNMEISLDHVTVVAARGLLNANSGDHGSLPEIQIELNDSICSVIGDEQIRQPLLEISGYEESELLLDKIIFKEGRNPSFIQVAGPFSTIDSTKTQLPGFGRELTAEEMGARNLRVANISLVLASATLKLADWHRLYKTDLELRPGDDNPALDGAEDLQRAGVDWTSSRLPPSLPRSASASSAN